MASTQELARAVTAKPGQSAEPLKTAEPQAAEPQAPAKPVKAAEPQAAEPEPKAKKKRAKLTPEEELEKIRQAQSKLGIKAARLQATMRKQADRRKYELGGLVVKSGLEALGLDNETLLGMFMAAAGVVNPDMLAGYRRKGLAKIAEDNASRGVSPAEVRQAARSGAAQAKPAGPGESSNPAGSRDAATAGTRVEAGGQDAGQGRVNERTAPLKAVVQSPV